MKLLSLSLLIGLGLSTPLMAQAPRVKSGYEVTGSSCWKMVDNYRVQ